MKKNSKNSGITYLIGFITFYCLSIWVLGSLLRAFLYEECIFNLWSIHSFLIGFGLLCISIAIDMYNEKKQDKNPINEIKSLAKKVMQNTN